MRRTDREITDIHEIQSILERTNILHLGLMDGDYPYIVPMHYAWEMKDAQPIFYLHCAKEGHKLDLIRQHSHACIQLENDVQLISGGDIPCKYGSEYASVIARGNIRIVDSVDEKVQALQLLMRHQTGREFVITPEQADTVEVLAFTPEIITAKARKVQH